MFNTNAIMMDGSRTLDDVNKIMGFAKLSHDEFLPKVQCLHFSHELDTGSIILMEVEPALLESLESGEKVVFRGDSSDSAVLCTETTTYQVKAKETSNNLLVIPHLEPGPSLDDKENRHVHHKEVVGMIQEYYDVLKVRPRLARLRLMMGENQFAGRECEEDEDHQGKKYTFGDIESRIQASDTEIRNGLKALQACCIDGFWRQLEFDFIGKVLDNIFALCDEESWEWSSIPGVEACNILQDTFPRNVVLHILCCFSTDDVERKEDQTFSLSEDKICRYNAEMLLKHIDKLNLTDFEESWQLTVPDGMKTGLYQLEGMVLIERDCKPHVIRYFPVEELPETVEERFLALFRAKAKWSLEEITPYINDVTTAKLGVGSLLNKYARSSMQNGIKVYNSKKLL